MNDAPRLQPLIIRPTDDARSILGHDVFCEMGHYAFTIGPVAADGWPALLDREGNDITGRYLGHMFPLTCAECGAIVARREPAS